MKSPEVPVATAASEPAPGKRIKNVVSNWFGLDAPPSYEEKSGIVYEGLLKMKSIASGDSKAKVSRAWRLRWFVLGRGTLFFYKDQMATKHEGAISLKVVKVMDWDDSKKNRGSARNEGIRFVLAGEEHGQLGLEASDPQNKTAWIKHIRNHLGKEPCKPPKRTVAAKKGKLFSTGKKLSEKAAMSKPGQKLLREHAPAEVMEVLDLVQQILLVVAGEEKGKLLYDHVMKITLKSIMLYKGKYITVRDFGLLQTPLFRLWSLFLDFVDMEFARSYGKLKERIDEVHTLLADMLRPHLTPKTINHRIKPLFEFLGDVDNLEKMFAKDERLLVVMPKLSKYLRKLWDNLPEEQKKIIHNIQLLSS